MSGILALLMGRRLCDRYHVHSIVGTGGMGAVCRATDERLRRDVAIKVLTLAPDDPEEQATLRRRFDREARAAAALRHPNVVTVFDFGTDPELGLDFLVMEYLPGRDVADRLAMAGGPLPVPEALEIFREAAMGMAAGHRAGLVHRDIKPRNIFLVTDPDGGWEVKVLDFGIAQLPPSADTMEKLTRAVAPHTPRYAAPEQTRGEPLTPACDVYSLGLTALEMLAGRYPEGVNTAPDDALAARWVAELNAARPDLPAAVAAVLLKALKRDPAARFADGNRLLAALDRAMAKASGQATSPGFATGVPSGIPPWSAPPAASRPAPAPPPGSEDEYTVAMGPARPAPARPTAPTPSRTVAETPPDPLRFGAPPGPPPVSPRPAGEAPAEVEDEAPPPRRKRRRMLAVLAGGGALAALVAIAAVAGGRAGEDAGSGNEPEVAWSDPYARRQIAQEEARRAVRVLGRVDAGGAAWVVVLASFPVARYREAMEMRDGLRRKGETVGVANSLVYPELRDGFAVVLSGPYAEPGEAEAELSGLRERVASDAFLRRVTLSAP